MEIKLYSNNLGLQSTADGRLAVRQVGKHMWAVQYREDPTNPWDWNILSYEETQEAAVALMTQKGKEIASQ